jgi:RNA polymerase-binding transcription factor DksA
MSNAVSRYSDADLAEFKALIEQKIKKTEEQIRLLQEQIMETTENTSDEFGGDWVDDSSTSSNVEMLNNMAIRQRKHLKDLENAMVRIKNKAYGICVVTGELIDKKRLMAVPTTTKSLAAKTSPTVVSSHRKEHKSNPQKKKVISKVIRKPSSPPKSTSSQPIDDDDMEIDDFLGEGIDMDEALKDFDEIDITEEE